MNVLSRLFGNSKVVQAGIDTIDAVFYTDEEKAEGKKDLLKAFEPFKIAQRLLALIFSIPYALAWSGTFIVSCFGIDVSAQERILAGTMGSIVIVIVGFYFTGGVINTINGLIKGKGK